MVLGLMPGVEIVGSARDGEEAISSSSSCNPDVVLMDLRCPAATASKQHAASDPERHHHEGRRAHDLRRRSQRHPGTSRRGLRLLTKDAGSQQIAAALEAAKRGESVIDPAVQHHLVNAIARTAPLQWTPPDQTHSRRVHARGKQPCSR